MARGVLFDLFGTVVVPFSRSRHDQALASAATSMGLDPGSAIEAWQADYPQRVRGLSGPVGDQLSATAAAQGVPVSEDSRDRAVGGYLAVCRSFMEPAPSAVVTLEHLQQMSVPVGLVSNAAPDFAAAFEGSPLRKLFTAATFSCHVGSAKPEFAVYAVAASALGLAPDELVFVGDGSDDELAGAQRAGLTAVLVRADYQDTYDPDRNGATAWKGPRIEGLDQVPELLDLTS